MNLMDVGLNSLSGTSSLGMKAGNTERSNSGEFENRFNAAIQSIEKTQVSTQEMVTSLLTTGEGDSAQTLIAMNKASSQIKMAAVVRDKLVENYQTIMNIQI